MYEFNELMTVDEVAAFLRISRDRTYQLVRCGAIHSFRVGRLIRVRQEDVVAFMTEMATESAG